MNFAGIPDGCRVWWHKNPQNWCLIHDLLKTIQNEHFSVEDLNKKNDTSPNFNFDIWSTICWENVQYEQIVLKDRQRKSITNIQIWDLSHRIGSHVDSFTHMQGFGSYIQHFVSPILEFRMDFVDKPWCKRRTVWSHGSPFG